MKFKAKFLYKPSNFQMEDCKIEKVVELSHDDFCKLKITPGASQPFIMENKDCMYVKDGYIHCLLALGESDQDGVLIYTHGCDDYLSAPGRFCSFSPNRKCRKMAGKGVQPLDNYTCRFCLSSLKQADKSGLDRLQAGKLAGV